MFLQNLTLLFYTAPKLRTNRETCVSPLSTDVGLAGYLFSRHVGRVWGVVERLVVGTMVGPDTGFVSQPVIPFGGVKENLFSEEDQVLK